MRTFRVNTVIRKQPTLTKSKPHNELEMKEKKIENPKPVSIPWLMFQRNCSSISSPAYRYNPFSDSDQFLNHFDPS